MFSETTFKILLLLLIFNASHFLFSQEYQVNIKVKPQNLPENSEVFITGNRDYLGEWNVMKKMELPGDSTWHFGFEAQKNDTIEFKFTRGNWATEAVDSNGLEYPNFELIVKSDTTLFYELPNWRDQVQTKIHITAERLENKAGFIELIEGWKHKIGDDSVWAEPDFDDSDWETINPALTADDIKKLDWTGNIWFRNHIEIDSSLLNKPFGFQFVQTGAAEIYLNGKLVYSFGEVGTTPETEVVFIERDPQFIEFKGQTEQVIAIRYSNHAAEKLAQFDIGSGFTAILGDLDFFISSRIENVREISIHQMLFGGFIFAFALMHFLIFLFYTKSKENLFYSIAMLAFAAVIYSGSQNNFESDTSIVVLNAFLNSVSVQVALIFGLLTVYATSYQKVPKQYIAFVVLSAVFIFFTIFFPTFLENEFEIAFLVFASVLILELIRVLIRSIFRKDSSGWEWIYGVGFLVAFLFIIYQVLIFSGQVEPLFEIYIVYVYGIIILAITVSVVLSKRFADTNRDLEKQLVQVKELSKKAIEQERKAKEEEIALRILQADNERKTRELEEARDLQLSMLPKKVPSIPDLDIAVYMKPATEVGGDYYDFKHNDNGKLFLAVGDATGHGMKAGTMVATIKGLFSSETSEMDITGFFDKCNEIIRKMSLGNIYMAMLLAKFSRGKMIFTSAGMPPVLVYRNGTSSVEELRLKGLPLGGSADFNYLVREIDLQQSDTILFMSDGFPELFNENKEMYDYSRANDFFSSLGGKSPKAIIDSLKDEVDKWLNGQLPQDDITFVVVKVK